MRQKDYREQEEYSKQKENSTQEDYRELEMPYELWLCSFSDISNRMLLNLIELCGSAREVYYADVHKWRQVLKEKQVESLKRYTESWKPEEEYRKLKEQGIRLITLQDPESD